MSRFSEFVQLCPLEEESDQVIGEIMKNKLHRKLLILTTLSTALLLTAGWPVFAYSCPQGEHFTRSSLGTKTSIQSLSVDSDTNAVRGVKLAGDQNDSTQTLGHPLLFGCTRASLLRPSTRSEPEASAVQKSNPNQTETNRNHPKLSEVIRGFLFFL
jgi:hypothetical protein